MSTHQSLPAYVEVGERLYAVSVRRGPIFSRAAQQVFCLVNRDDQTIQLDRRVPDAQRPALLAEAVATALPSGWRPVPVVGSVS